jgi:Homeodomain-like domain
MRSSEELDAALRLLRSGASPTEAGRILGIPRSTVRDWSYGKGAGPLRRSRSAVVPCMDHEFGELDASRYAYLLGMYLGDGYLSRHHRGVFHLRIALDSRYPVIVEECRLAVEAVAPNNRASVYQRRDGNCVEVSSYWRHWPCLVPQHGPGRKHERRIQLVSWQRSLVNNAPTALLRGLIHSDGCRIIATERKGNYVRRAPRYGFSNRSEDILQLFASTCEQLGIHYTRSSAKQIAIYSKDAVARLDEFVGPKA